MKSFLKRFINKFYYAFCGLFHGLGHDFSIRLQYLIGLVVIIVCAFLSLNMVEWCIIILCIGGVIALEYVNSAIETLCDMISPDYNELAKKVKDYGSGAVLALSLAALIIGLIIIGGKLWMMIS